MKDADAPLTSLVSSWLHVISLAVGRPTCKSHFPKPTIATEYLGGGAFLVLITAKEGVVYCCLSKSVSFRLF